MSSPHFPRSTQRHPQLPLTQCPRESDPTIPMHRLPPQTRSRTRSFLKYVYPPPLAPLFTTVRRSSLQSHFVEKTLQAARTCQSLLRPCLELPVRTRTFRLGRTLSCLRRLWKNAGVRRCRLRLRRFAHRPRPLIPKYSHARSVPTWPPSTASRPPCDTISSTRLGAPCLIAANATCFPLSSQ